MSSTSNIVVPFGQGYVVVRSRQRITLDGGTSLLAVPKGPQIHQSDVDEIPTTNKTNARSAVGGCSDTGYSSSSSGIDESQYHATAPVVTDPTPTLSDEALWYGMREPGFVEYDWGAGQSTIIFSSTTRSTDSNVMVKPSRSRPRPLRCIRILVKSSLSHPLPFLYIRVLVIHASLP